MKQRKLAPLLATTLSLQMMVSPLTGLAADTKSTSSSSSVKASDVVLGTSEAFSKTIQAAGQIWSTVNQIKSGGNSGLSGQAAFDMQKFKEQQTPQTDKYFNPQKLGRIPGLAEYMAMNNINPAMLDCKTLPTTLHEAKNEVCSIGVTTDRGVAPQAQLAEMQAYSNQYFQIDKMYRNYSANSNSEGQLFGVGCMKNAQQILNGFFRYRLDELDKLTTNLEAMNNQFREASRSDLDAIEESVAVLEGGSSELTDKVKSKKPDLFDFGKRFDNAACTSMFAKDQFNQLGRGNGLNAINQRLKDTLSEKPPGSKYSGESYATSHSAVVEDLNNLADKVSKQAELRFSEMTDPQGYAGFLKGLPSSVSSVNGANNTLTSDFFSDVQTRFSEKSNKLQAEFNTIANELSAGGANPAKALSIVKNLTTSNFDNEVVAIENQLKNGCLKNAVSLDTMIDKIYDPMASKYANEHASNFLKDKLKSIMENDKTSLDKKLSDLKTLEAQQGNRYYVKMENSYQVQEADDSGNIKSRVVEASTRRSPSAFFSDIIRNCEAQFKVNKLDNQLSGADAIKKLRSLHSSYKSLAKSHASEMKAEIKKKLIDCASADDANNTAIGSCTSDRFNTTAPGFCANAALSCSKNMQSCNQQAEKYVTEIKAQKTARVNNYKALVEKNKKDIVKIFDTALSKYMRDGELLRGLFGTGFSSPSDIKREVMPESARYIDIFQQATSNSPDGKLLLEDPEKYVDMFKKNIALLKKSVEDQQNQIIGDGDRGLLAKHIKQTEKNYSEVAKAADKMAEKCDRFYNDYVKAQEMARGEQQKKNNELGEKRADFCNRFNLALDQNNGPACKGNMEDTFKAVTSIDGGRSARQLQALCDNVNNETGDSNRAVVKALKYCKAPPAPTKPGTKKEDKDKPKEEADEVATTTVSSSTVSSNCEELLKCMKKKSTGTGDNKEVIECETEEKQYLAELIIEENGGSELNIDSTELPAFCGASDNSGRNSSNPFQKGLETIQQELEKTRAARQ